MAVYADLLFVDVEVLGPPRAPDTDPRRGDREPGYGWAWDEWHRSSEKERGFLIPEGMLPSSVVMTGTTASFPIFCPGRLSIGVSQRFRDVIERFEPGIHQFVSFQLLNIDKTPVSEPYYFMNIMTCIDAFLISYSAAEWVVPRKPAKASARAPYIRILDDQSLSLSRPKIAGKHLWRSPTESYYFFSEQMYAALVDAGFYKSIYGLIHYSELDVVWDRPENRGPWDDWKAAAMREGN